MTNPKLSKNVYLEKILSVVLNHDVISKYYLINTCMKMTRKIIVTIISTITSIIIMKQHHVLSTCT